MQFVTGPLGRALVGRVLNRRRLLVPVSARTKYL